MAAQKGYTAPLAREGACDRFSQADRPSILLPSLVPPGQGRDLRKNVRKNEHRFNSDSEPG